jgi:hypothetical protein
MIIEQNISLALRLDDRFMKLANITSNNLDDHAIVFL